MKMLGNHNMHYRNISMIIIMIFTIIMIGNYYIQLADKMPTINAYDKPVGVSVSGGEYLLGDMKYGYLRWRSVGCDFEHVQVSDYEYNDGITKFYCKNASDKSTVICLPLINYDNYHAYGKNGTEPIITNGENNHLSVMLKPNYEGEVIVRYEMPVLWLISHIVSIITCVVLVIIYLRKNIN